MTIANYLFDIAKIIEGATNSDFTKIVAYADQLSGRLRADGEVGAAKRVQEIVSRSKAKKLSLARSSPNGDGVSLPVDSESRLAVADEEFLKSGQIPLFLPSDQQKEVDRFLRCFKAADRLIASGVGISASMLLFGPPGCGKTQLARYVAANLGLPILTARADALISSYLGSTAKNVRALFEHAASRPCVLFLDEFDALAKMRDDTRELGELKRVVISLLQNIDAMGTDHVLIAATNHEHLLDPAIWRRFAYKLRLNTPTFECRVEMLIAFFGKFASAEQVQTFAAVSEGMTGARLKQIAEDAIRDAVLDGVQGVQTLRTIEIMLSNGSQSNEQIPLPKMVCAVRDRDPRRFTQSRLANIFGVSQGQVSKMLNHSEDRNGRGNTTPN